MIAGEGWLISDARSSFREDALVLLESIPGWSGFGEIESVYVVYYGIYM